VEPADITVYPGQPGVCTIKFAPPRQATNAAGAWNFGVLADSQVTPGLQASAVGSVQLGGFRALSVTLQPGAAAKQTLYVDNQGNMPEQVALAGSDSEGLLRFEMPPGVTVNPGRSAVPFRVRARRDWFGKPKRVPYRLVATPSDGQPVSADGVRVLRPLLGVLPLVLAGVLVAAAAGGVALKMRSSGDTSESGGGPIAVAPTTPSSEEETTAEETPTEEATTEEPTTPPPPAPPPTPEITTPSPSADPSKVLIEYRREGGQAGWADTIVVYGNGRATVTKVSTNLPAQLSPDQLTRLNESLANLQLGESEPEPGGADYITYRMIKDGVESVRYNFLPDDWQSVADILNPILDNPSS
jgi:hypothetical protein